MLGVSLVCLLPLPCSPPTPIHGQLEQGPAQALPVAWLARTAPGYVALRRLQRGSGACVTAGAAGAVYRQVEPNLAMASLCGLWYPASLPSNNQMGKKKDKFLETLAIHESYKSVTFVLL